MIIAAQQNNPQPNKPHDKTQTENGTQLAQAWQSSHKTCAPNDHAQPVERLGKLVRPTDEQHPDPAQIKPNAVAICIIAGECIFNRS
jgi:hypothetical protein